jgi:hypothetical protein
MELTSCWIRYQFFDVTRDNYSSVTITDNLLEASRMVNDQIKLGVLEPEVTSTRVTHPLGLVAKKLAPGEEGPAKYRLITDARATGLNE